MKEIVDRLKKPTPKFWKKIQKIGMFAAALSVALSSAPFAVPAGVLWALGSAGTITTILSQLTIEDKVKEKDLD
ncbi:hypothetical protein UFOVP695_20 [uncultured Caudovirales phage]|uniref:Uncharacterized protein n=1 Tax=uncultured Caudovirales phage TaxID=2100421 RepID=A0A6J5NHD9_9CAUD|nr:hypothetical protein UFOVP695_20 [uncultured Caudovirales phage]